MMNLSEDPRLEGGCYSCSPETAARNRQLYWRLCELDEPGLEKFKLELAKRVVAQHTYPGGNTDFERAPTARELWARLVSEIACEFPVAGDFASTCNQIETITNEYRAVVGEL